MKAYVVPSRRATAKSEEFNEFTKWLSFGNPETITENLRHEQQKMVKYNHLVANMLILYNVDEMTRVLSELLAEGYPIDESVLAYLSPYRREHVNRFGHYTVDMHREVPPLHVDVRLFKVALLWHGLADFTRLLAVPRVM